MYIKYPIAMIGRRASGKTTLLAVLKAKSGFYNRNGNTYRFASEDRKTIEHLDKVFYRILEQNNPTPTGRDELEEIALYADVNGHRIDFVIPDISGDWFENDESNKKSLNENIEIYRKFEDYAVKSGALIVLVPYEDIISGDFRIITESLRIILNRFKEKDRSILPFVVVAVTKLDLHPLFKENYYEFDKNILQELYEQKSFIEIIRGLVGENFALVPLSSLGGHTENEEGENFPPKSLEPIGVVELFESALKGMIIQNARYEFNNADKELDNALVNLKRLLDISPYADINREIQEKIDVVESKISKIGKKTNIVQVMSEFYETLCKVLYNNNGKLEYLPSLVGLKIIPDFLSGILYFLKEALKIVLKKDDDKIFEEFINKIEYRYYVIWKRILEYCKVGGHFTLLDLILCALGLDPLRFFMSKNYEELSKNSIFIKLEKNDKLTSFELLIALLCGVSVMGYLEKIVNFRILVKDILKHIVRFKQ